MNGFKNFTDCNVFLWHSQTTDSYRKKFKKLNQTDPCIVIGARSALFTPLKNLGLIIVDEEHNRAYKEVEKQPCYNARDLSIVRAKFSNAPIVFFRKVPS